MSYDINEVTLADIMQTLRHNYPELQKWLVSGHKIEVLHGHVEMLHALIELYDRGEIIRLENSASMNGSSDPKQKISNQA